MKLCLFSDIHANKYAFEAALPLILKEKADTNIFLGDLCGYYFDTVEVWQMLQSIPNLFCIRGNHDDMFLLYYQEQVVLPEYTKKYGPSLELLMKSNPAKLVDFVAWLEKMPKEIRCSNQGFLCCHDFPDGKNEYLYPSMEVANEGKDKYVFFGHTHHRFIRSKGKSTFVNPGSLGQPRDRFLPSFATVVLETGEVKFHEFRYNFQALLGEIEERGPLSPYLSEVIRRSFCS